MATPFWKSPFLAAIIGRPNVGKSTLFNTLIGLRVAIVDPTPGVTRDRLVHSAKAVDRYFDVMDTGGIGIVDMQKLEELVEWQITAAIGVADLILFVVDVKDGLTPMDAAIAETIRKTSKPTLLLANKCDVGKFDVQAEEFRRLGIARVFPISAQERRGLDEVLEYIESILPDADPAEEDPNALKLAIVGRRNVGKSSFVNFLAGEERVIVSEVPGTTRDAVEVSIESPGLKLVAIDTAGLRKKSSIRHPIELFSTFRTENALSRANAVILMIDAEQGISNIEKHIASLVAEEFKPCVIVVNKWDLAGELDPDKYTEYIGKTLSGLDHCPIIYISVKDGDRADKVIPIAQDLLVQWRSTWSTSLVNDVIGDAQNLHRPKVKAGSLPKMYYATQVSTAPPTFLIFVNRPEFFADNYRRFLVNYLRKRLKVPEIPLRIVFRERREPNEKE